MQRRRRSKLCTVTLGSTQNSFAPGLLISKAGKVLFTKRYLVTVISSVTNHVPQRSNSSGRLFALCTLLELRVVLLKQPWERLARVPDRSVRLHGLSSLTLSCDCQTSRRSCIVLAVGKRRNKTHTLCRRCGRRSFHIQKTTCSSCGYPAARIRKCKGSVAPKAWHLSLLFWNVKGHLRPWSGSCCPCHHKLRPCSL